ncbi:MAG: tetratricopeptide repeat protein [Bacteroidales bacterium]|nr:tetratricopeptide repeat protein [Bacteroidales bacterium]
MAKISLRSYIREIDSLVDQERFDEAIAHCRHILSQFPKHIDTYRLLGKAYLERNQNSNAADIFQRVLSAIPDDFVSHIGMSLIREEEGNLKAAVSHMERAFEKQPYNNAIQEEIRRLYGKRDGVEPSKVRLTQGALARMYLKGGLFSQGISELRSALSEQPQRFDLRTLLAEAYQEADHMGKAIEVASTILKKFPFNLTSNRILANTLKTHDHPEEMAICRKRLYALSPYEAYVSEHAPTADDVPDRAIEIQKLDRSDFQQDFDIKPGEGVDWAAAFSNEPEVQAKEAEEPVPDWLAGETDEGESSQESITTDESLSVQDKEPQKTEKISGAMETEDEIEEEPVPDWLAGAAEDGADIESGQADEILPEQESSPPEEFEKSEDMKDEMEEEPVPDWLAGAAEDKADIESGQADEIIPEQESAPPEDIDKEEGMKDEREEKPVPDWLAGDADDYEPQEEEFKPTEETLSISDQETLEDSEESIDQEKIGADEMEEASIPGWMSEVGWEPSDGEIGEPEDIYEEGMDQEDELEPADIPEWLQQQTPTDAEAEPPEAPSREESDIPDDQVPSAQKQPDDLSQGEDMDQDDIPAWLTEEDIDKPQPTSEVASEEEPTSTATPPVREDFEEEQEKTPGSGTEDFPAWLRDIKSDEDKQETTVAWLNNLPDEPPLRDEDIAALEGEDFLESESTIESMDDLNEPDWIKNLSKTPPSQETELDHEESEEPEFPDLPFDSSTEEALTDEAGEKRDEEPSEVSWEESPEEFEEDPISKFEMGEGLVSDQMGEKEESFPDWLAELDEEEPQQEAEPDSELPEEQAADVSDGVSDMAPEPSLSKPVSEAIDEEQEIPGWLEEEDEEAQQPGINKYEPISESQDSTTEERAHPTYSTEGKPSPEEEEEIPDWMGDLEPAERPESAAIDADEDKEDVITSDVKQETELFPQKSDLEEEEETLAWLESLAERQGAEKDSFVTSAEQRADVKPPETEEEVAPEVMEEEISKAEMPDWLSELEPEKADEEEEFQERHPEEGPSQKDTAETVHETEKAEEETLPDWLAELEPKEREAVFEDQEPEDQDIREQVSKPSMQTSEEPIPTTEETEEALPDWLGELEREEEKDIEDTQTPSGGKETESIPSLKAAEEKEEIPPISGFDKDIEEDEAWLDSLSLSQKSDIEEAISPRETSEEIPPQPDGEDLQEDFLTKKEEMTEAEEEEEEAADWLADLETADDQAREFMAAEDAPERAEPSESSFSEGMLKRLGEEEELEESAPVDEEEKVPDWLVDFKEEEDPQETAVLWLRNFVEKGEDVDVKEEIRQYTDELDSDEIPEWMEDLQKEEDPTSTAMLWLDKLESEQRDTEVQKLEIQEEDTDDETDWIAELEKEQERLESEKSFEETDDFDVDEGGWLADLEREESVASEKETKTPFSEETDFEEKESDEEETPPWMLATSPLEGDLLTGDLTQDDQEEIPEWLSGETEAEQEEEEVEGQGEDDEYQWLSAYREEETTQKEKLNINVAAISQLESILGISYQIAEGIVSYRELNGPFEKIEDLKDVPEITDNQTIEILRSEVTLRVPESAVPEEKEYPKEEEKKSQPEEVSDVEDTLKNARNMMASGEIDQALSIYENMIEEKENIEEVIEELSEATYEHPMNVSIIKTLGDAYMSTDKLQEALDAYSKAEDLLR